MKDHPAPLALPVTGWPDPVRKAWLLATTPADSLFGPGSAAARLRPRTIKIWERDMGYFLGFLQRDGVLDPRNTFDLVTPEWLDRYVAAQRRRGNRNTTIAKRLEGLHAALRLIAPQRDFRFILRPGGQSLRRAFPATPRPADVRSQQELIALVLTLFRQGLAGESYARGHAAIRDAALLGILTMRAPRIGSLAAVELGRQLQDRDGTLWLQFEDEDMKEGEPLWYPLPEILRPVLETYIAQVRPAFGGNHTPCLWVGTKGRPMSARDLGKVVRRRTKAWFGVAKGPHWFRKCLTTTAALETPEAMLDVCSILGHSPEVSLRHYNAANAVAAAQRHNQRITRLKARTWLRAARVFGWRERRAG